MLHRLHTLLTEALMGFLALLATAAVLTPLLFPIPLAIEHGCEVISWLIVAVFALEYIVNLNFAADRLKFVLNPHHVLDALIVLTALASLLPAVSGLARSSPALRIVRAIRAAVLSARVPIALRPDATGSLPRAAPAGPPHVSVLRPDESEPCTGEWSDLLQWATSSRSNWSHASNLSPERLKDIAEALDVPHVMIEAALHEASYPRLESGLRWSVLTMSIPSWENMLRRDLVLLLTTELDVLSLAVHPLDLQHPPVGFESLPWGPRCALHVIRAGLVRYEEVAGRLERAARQLEQLPPDDSPELFFEQTFHLKHDLSATKGDLWRLRGLLEMLGDGRRALPGLGPAEREKVRELAEEADFLYETADEILESVLSLIDLHINVAAHDTNRFMRLLAAMSALALIPAVVGGLLGMNLVDAPWKLTLGQVAFVTLLAMVAVLYAFLAKGWLR